MTVRSQKSGSDDDAAQVLDAQATDGTKRGRGRPRDPQLEERAIRATLDVFGEKGWAGLTFDEVSARAKVGKSSLYLRWPTKERLLADALYRSQVDRVTQIEREAEDAGEDAPEVPLRTYLIDHATQRADLYLGPNGVAMLRLYVEDKALPKVFAEIRRDAITSFVLEQRRRVESAIVGRGLPERASAVRILDAIEGAVLMHILVTPPELEARMRRNLPTYIEDLVDTQLRANGAE